MTLSALASELPIQCGSSIVWCTLAVCGPVIRGQALCLAPTMGPSDGRLMSVMLRKPSEWHVKHAAKSSTILLLSALLCLSCATRVCVTVHPGNGIDEGDKQPIACIGPGTGLGNASAFQPAGALSRGAIRRRRRDRAWKPEQQQRFIPGMHPCNVSLASRLKLSGPH